MNFFSQAAPAKHPAPTERRHRGKHCANMITVQIFKSSTCINFVDGYIQFRDFGFCTVRHFLLTSVYKTVLFQNDFTQHKYNFHWYQQQQVDEKINQMTKKKEKKNECMKKAVTVLQI